MSVWFLDLKKSSFLYVGFRAYFRISFALGNWWWWCGAGVITEEHAHFLPSVLLKEGVWRHPPHFYFMSALSFFLPHPFLELLNSDSSGAWEWCAIAWYSMVFKCSVFESKSFASLAATCQWKTRLIVMCTETVSKKALRFKSTHGCAKLSILIIS